MKLIKIVLLNSLLSLATTVALADSCPNFSGTYLYASTNVQLILQQQDCSTLTMSWQYPEGTIAKTIVLDGVKRLEVNGPQMGAYGTYYFSGNNFVAETEVYNSIYNVSSSGIGTYLIDASGNFVDTEQVFDSDGNFLSQYTITSPHQ